MGRTAECRDCGELIEFIEGRNGKWIPARPGTEERHRCQLDQTCEGCQKTFKGANWMKVCPDCYRSGGRSSRSSPEPASPPRTREDVKGGGSDDVPF